MRLKDKQIVVVGLGRTGLATARFLHQQGARVLVADTADETQLGDYSRRNTAGRFSQDAAGNGCRLGAGSASQLFFSKC
jgi:UDP-N-acetylmuramoylalanine-D-glutamate ligase